MAPKPPAISRIGLYEAQAVFHKKEAEGGLLAGGAQLLYSQITRDMAAGKIALIDLGGGVEQEYSRILISCYQNKPIISIRTLDAIHLATARSASKGEIVATDKKLRDAAKMLGFSLFPA